MKDIKRGYPNPNYTDEDIQDGIPLEMNAEIMVDDTEYRQLVSKAAALDIITADIKAKLDYGYDYNLVNDDIVLAVTGMNVYKRKIKAERKEEKADGED